MPMKAKLFFISCWFIIGPILAQAQDTTEQQPAKSESIYVEMHPAFIVTFGGPGPLKYLKAEVTLIVPSGKAESNVKLHMPALRHSLVMLLSRQTSESVATATGRDHISEKALEEFRNILLNEYGSEGYGMVKRLLFTSFVVQE